LSFVLVLVGSKMVVNAALGPVIQTEWALFATAVIIGSSVWLSILRTRGLPPEVAADEALRGWVPLSPAKETPADPDEK
jgi:tellurite resistance protein TerC